MLLLEGPDAQAWHEVFPLERPLTVVCFSRVPETLRVVRSRVPAPSIMTLQCPVAPGGHEAAPGMIGRLARLAAEADLIVQDVAYLDGPELFTLALRAEAPTARLVVLSADPFHLGWLRRFARPYGCVDAVMGSPLSLAEWHRLLFGILAWRLATPRTMRTLLDDEERE